MPLHKQLLLLAFLGAVLLGLVSFHTVPEIVSPSAMASGVETAPEPEPPPTLAIRWGPPGSALAGRVEAERARRPYYGPLPEGGGTRARD